MTMLYSDEDALSSLDKHKLFFSFQEKYSSLVSHTTHPQRGHTHSFLCRGGHSLKVKRKLLGTQSVSQGFGTIGSLFRSLKQSHGTKQGICALKPHHWEGD